MAGKTRIGILIFVGLVMWGGFYLFRGAPRSEIFISDQICNFIDTIDRDDRDSRRKLVVIDFDDTFVKVKKFVGSPTWFYHTVNMLRQKGASQAEAIQVARGIELGSQGALEMVLVEQASLTAVERLRSLGAAVICLTMRPRVFADMIKGQLAKMNVNFSSAQFACIEESFGEDNGFFSEGVLYVNDAKSKALVLHKFIERSQACGQTFDLIAYVDDQGRYVSEVAQVAQKQQADFIGMIYGGGLAAREYDPKGAALELKTLEADLGIRLVPEAYRQALNL